MLVLGLGLQLVYSSLSCPESGVSVMVFAGLVPLSLHLVLLVLLLFHLIVVSIIIIHVHGLGIVHTHSHIHFIASTIEALGLTIHSNGSRDGDTICIFLCLNWPIVWCSTLEASTKWPFKSGLETLCQEGEECVCCRRVG